MWAGDATRLKVGPVIPGLAAKTAGVINGVAAITARSSCFIEIFFFMFIGVIAALLVVVARIAKCVPTRDGGADVNFGHEPAEILGVVGQVVEIGRVEVERAL